MTNLFLNNVLREYNEIKEEIKNPETSVKYIKYRQWKPIVSVPKHVLLKKIQMSNN